MEEKKPQQRCWVGAPCGRAVWALLASSTDSAAFPLCESCKLTPLQLFIGVCSSPETPLLKQAFICWVF